MLTRLEMNDKVQTLTYGSLVWDNIINPTEKAVAYLSKKHKFHHLDLEDCLSKIQRPKIDEYEKELFIVLHFPYYDKTTDSIMQDEINIFIGPKYVITLSPGNKVLTGIFDKIKRRPTLRNKYMGSTSGYLLYKIIDEMFAACFPLVDNLSAEIDEIEDAVFETEKPRDKINR